jgi:hypothetical protein
VEKCFFSRILCGFSRFGAAEAQKNHAVEQMLSRNGPWAGVHGATLAASIV